MAFLGSLLGFGSKSESIMKQYQEIATKTITNATMQCAGSAENINEFNGRGMDIAGKLDMSNMTFNQDATVNVNCLQSNSTTDKISQDLNSAFKQQAETIGQMFQLTKNESSNVSELSQKLANDLIRSFTAKCLPSAVNSWTRDFEGARIRAGGELDMSGTTVNQTATLTTSCVQNTFASSDNAIQLKTTLDQLTKTKTTFFLDGLFGSWTYMAIAVIVGITAIVLVMLLRSRK
jgi:hypothetical protein